MQYRFWVVAICLMTASICSGSVDPVPAIDKPRLIVITDIGTEPDDVQSIVRLLTYANDLDIEGLIASTSKHLPDQVHPEYIEKRIRTYGEVLTNLRAHDKNYPPAEQLLKVVRGADPVYGLKGAKAGAHKQAAQLIIDAVDRNDSRPVWVTIWGGAAPLAAALSRVNESRSPKEVAKFVDKLRVYSISDQDDAGPWIRMAFPQLFWVSSLHALGEYRLSTWAGIMSSEPGSQPELVNHQWLHKHIQTVGPLGSLYPSTIFGMEGDSPSFLYLIPNGLGNPEHPNWGSWGGRYAQIADFLGIWTDTVDTVTGTDGKSYASNAASVWRWREAFQNDFSARMDWSVTDDFSAANHPPTPVVNGEKGLAPIRLQACAGEPVKLDAAESSDVDGDGLSYRWLFYREVLGSYSPELKLSHTDKAQTTAVVPVWLQPDKIKKPDIYQLHAVLAVTDSGTPALTRYRRVIISVPTQGQHGCAPIALAPARPPTDFVVPLTHSDARYSTNNRIGELLDNPDTRAVLEKYLPQLVQQMSSSPQARDMTLRAVAYFNSSLSNELLQTIDDKLAEIK